MAGTEARRHQEMVEAGVPAGHFDVTSLKAKTPHRFAYILPIAGGLLAPMAYRLRHDMTKE